ncbi:hypothetical protein [Holdemania massiliensis]|nr:hypothetical protein [Holdemania massiliensis]
MNLFKRPEVRIPAVLMEAIVRKNNTGNRKALPESCFLSINR